MLPAKAKHEILDLAVDDWTPLFDVPGVVKACLGHRPVDEQIEVARTFVRYLLSQEYVELYYDCLAKSTEDHRHVERLTTSEMGREMTDRANWLYHERRPPDERWVTIGATPAGEGAVYRCMFPTC